jgi:SAM-dependent methyltransferase
MIAQLSLNLKKVCDPMNTELIRVFDAQTLRIFAAKGTQGGPTILQTGNANGVKVRRIMQITRDLALKPFDQLRILDLACGEGVYSIEAGLRGAAVTGVDARSSRMDDGIGAATRLGLSNVRFLQQDIRELNAVSIGTFDTIYFLGILYHLAASDILPMMKRLFTMTNHALIIDTHVAAANLEQFSDDGITLQGRHIWEHNDSDTQEVRDARLLASIDNPQSFYLTRDSLVQTLLHVGFTSVFECCAPLEPGKPEDRRTIVALKNQQVKLSSYPWINGKSESEIAAFLGVHSTPTTDQEPQPQTQKSRIRLLNRLLAKIGLEIRRIAPKA